MARTPSSVVAPRNESVPPAATTASVTACWASAGPVVASESPVSSAAKSAVVKPCSAVSSRPSVEVLLHARAGVVDCSPRQLGQVPVVQRRELDGQEAVGLVEELLLPVAEPVVDGPLPVPGLVVTAEGGHPPAHLGHDLEHQRDEE